MTIDEAIEANRDTLHQHERYLPLKQRDAIRLGNQALKRIKAQRIEPRSDISIPLSGETDV